MHIDVKFFVLGCLIFFSSTIFCQEDKTGSLLEKGSMYAGLLFSFDVSNTENEQQTFTTIQDRKNNEFTINVNSGYFLKKNWALGHKFRMDGKKG